MGRSESDGADDLPKLGSLAQSARVKELNTARNILIAIGILTIIVSGIQLATVRDQVHKAVQADLAKQGVVGFPPQVQQFEENAVLISYAILGISVALGVLFFVFGLLVKTFPVPITIISLVLYVASALVSVVINPALLQFGVAILVRVIIVIALAKAIQSAFVYQKEKRFEELGRDYA